MRTDPGTPGGKLVLGVPVLVVIGAIGWLDYRTGPEIAFSLFYLVPIVGAAWWLGVLPAFLAAAAAAVAWFAADAAWYAPSHLPITLWNALTRLVLFGFVGVTVARTRRQLAHAETGRQRAEDELRRGELAHRADRTETERALRESENRYRSLVHGAAYGIYRSTLDGRFLYVNPALVATLGYASEAELLSVNIPRDIYRDPEERRRLIATAIESGGLVTAMELGWKRKDGAPITVQLSGRAVLDARGAPDGFEVIVEDVTERRRAEEGLRLFRTLIDHSHDAIEVVDPETGRFLDVNERACLDLGYRREELLALSVLDVDPTVTPERFAAVTTRLKQSGSVIWEGIHRRKDGSTFPVEVDINYVELDRSYIVTVVRDITQRKQAEAERVRLSTVAEQAAESVVITDTAGAIQFVNPGFERMTGYGRQEVLGQNPRILKSGKQDAAFYRALWDRLTRGEAWSGRLINRRKDGTEYHVQQVISPLRDPAGSTVGYAGIGHDVTAEVELESQLRQAQKLEAVGRLAAGVAHDFNNLLTVVLGESDMALAALPPDHALRPSLEQIRLAGERASGLTRQLLTFSRKQLVEFTVFSLNDVLTSLDKMLRRLIREDISLIMVQAPDAGLVRADRGQLEQVVANLVVNAVDAMPKGGRLSLETRSDSVDEAFAAAHEGLASGEHVVLAVADTGIGMTDQVKAHLFEPFFTTKGPGKGTGLGLATSYAIVRQAGGQLVVESVVGTGTTMNVYLPVVRERKTPVPAGGTGALPRGSETILLAEDEPGVRHVACEILGRLGYRLLEASDGVAALGVLERHQGEIHLLLTDVIMPGMGGRDLAERARALRPGLRILFASGYSDASVLEQLRQGGLPLLKKPFTRESLAHKVREVLDAKAAG